MTFISQMTVFFVLVYAFCSVLVKSLWFHFLFLLILFDMVVSSSASFSLSRVISLLIVSIFRVVWFICSGERLSSSNTSHDSNCLTRFEVAKVMSIWEAVSLLTKVDAPVYSGVRAFCEAISANITPR